VLQKDFHFPETYAGGLPCKLCQIIADGGRRQIRRRDVLQDVPSRTGLAAEGRTLARNNHLVRHERLPIVSVPGLHAYRNQKLFEMLRSKYT